MAQQARFVARVGVGDGPPTTVADRTLQGAFDRQDELARLRQFGLNDADIGDVQRDREERLLRHRHLSGRTYPVRGAWCHRDGLPATTTSRAFHGKA